LLLLLLLLSVATHAKFWSDVGCRLYTCGSASTNAQDDDDDEVSSVCCVLYLGVSTADPSLHAKTVQL